MQQFGWQCVICMIVDLEKPCFQAAIIMLGIGMCILHRLLRRVTITGLYSVGSIERA